MNIFTQPVTQAYDKSDATVEILIMLVVAFLLGWLLRYSWEKMRCGGARGCATGAAAVPAQFAQYAEDDLKIVEGIGPKIEELLNADGIRTWRDLANADTEALRDILQRAGSRFQMHDPETWAEQAQLAVDGAWKKLEEYQDFLNGGKAK